jgi:hypothetical protein
MISFISIAPAMTSEVIIITRQYCNYNPLYPLAPSKIITSKRRDQSSTYLYVALFNVFMRYQLHVAKTGNPPLATCS